MHYIILYKGNVIDVAKDKLNTAKWVRNRIMLCEPEDSPCGISSDRHGVVWQVEGWVEFPPEAKVDTVQLVECSETEYEIEKQRLDRGEETMAELKDKVEQNKADIEYVAMMADIDLEV